MYFYIGFYLKKEKKQKEMLQEMFDEITHLKAQYERELKKLEENIEQGASDVEIKYILNFCKDQEKHLQNTQENIKEERKKLRLYIENLLRNKEEIEKLEFKNKLQVVIFLLEDHLDTKKPMEADIKMLQRLGENNEFIREIAISLMNDEYIKKGLIERKEILQETNSSIPKAKLGVFVGENKGFSKYFLSFIIYLMMKWYKFKPSIGKYIEKDESKLLKNVRNVDYIEYYVENREYEKALEIIKNIDGLAVEELKKLKEMLEKRVGFKYALKVLKSCQTL